MVSYNKLAMVHCKYTGVTNYALQKIVLFYYSDRFVLANSEISDEMSDYGAFYLGLHCWPKYMFRSHCYT